MAGRERRDMGEPEDNSGFRGAGSGARNVLHMVQVFSGKTALHAETLPRSFLQ